MLGLADFTRLSSLVSLYIPPQSPIPSDSNNDDPSLVILCTWMNAPPKLIDKYIAEYHARFSHSAILLITSTTSAFFFMSTAELGRKLIPAVSVVDKYSATNTSTQSPVNRIAAALYSNGGCYSLSQLVQAFAATHTPKRPLPLSRLLVDSAPGHGTLELGLPAVMAGVPPSLSKGLIGSLIGLLVHAVLWCYIVYQRDIVGIENMVDKARADLNDPRAAPVEAHRTYVYGDADVMVPWTAVEDHAREAEAKGCKVTLERFEGSKHVAHAMADKERYWRAVEACLRATSS